MPPSTTVNQETIPTLAIHQEVDIVAPIEVAWEAVLDQMGPKGEMPDGTPFPFKLEAWPGGRLYRDLGNSGGHLWGHVQVIKPPKLLEIWGPMMMSYPAVRSRSRTCSARTANCSSTTSCSARTGPRGARVARSCAITSTARRNTWRRGTCRW